MALVFEPNLCADLDQTHPFVGKQAFGLFDSGLREKALRGFAGGAFEGPGEVKRAETGDGG